MCDLVFRKNRQLCAFLRAYIVQKQQVGCSSTVLIYVKTWWLPCGWPAFMVLTEYWKKKAFALETPRLFWSSASWEQISVSGPSACKSAWDLLDELRPLFIQRMGEKKNEKICSLSLSLSCRSVSTHTKLKSADFHQCFSVWAATVEGACIGAHST